MALLEPQSPVPARPPEEKEVSVVDTDYKTYAIMDVVQHRGGRSHRVLKLYSEPRRGRGGVGVLLTCASALPPEQGDPSSDRGQERAKNSTGWGGYRSGPCYILHPWLASCPPPDTPPPIPGRSLDHNEEALRRLQEVAGEYGFTPWEMHLLRLDREFQNQGPGSPQANPPKPVETPSSTSCLTLPVIHSDLRELAAAGELPHWGCAHLSSPPHMETGVWSLRGAGSPRGCQSQGPVSRLSCGGHLRGKALTCPLCAHWWGHTPFLQPLMLPPVPQGSAPSS